MTGLFQRCRVSTGVFLSWWQKELLSCIPKGIRRPFERSRDILFVTLDGASVVLHQGWPGSSPLLQAVNLEEGDEAERLARLRPHAARLAARRNSSVLCLPVDLVSRCRASLPLEAIDNLWEVISFEIDRITPCRRDDVLFDCHVLEQDRTNKKVVVEVVYSRRAAVEHALEAVRKLSLEPAKVVPSDRIDEFELGLNLLPSDSGFRHFPTKSHRMAFALCIILCLLATAAVYLPIHQKRIQLAEIQGRIEAMKAEAQRTIELRRQAEELAEQDQLLTEVTSRPPSVIVLLEELTRLLPDDTWIVRLNWANPRLSVSGFSREPAQLVGLLEGSKFVEEAAFSSPMTIDVATGLKRFDLQAVKANAIDKSE